MKTDWVAEVFSAMRDSGEDISIVYGYPYDAAAPARAHWFELQHNEYDGVAGLACLLRHHGQVVDRLPQLTNDRLTFARGLRGVLSVLPEVKSRQRQWRRFDAARQAAKLPVDQRVAWHSFSAPETQAIVAAAKVAGVSVNTFLLHRLDGVVKHLTPPSTARRWMLPINLRGAVTRALERSPHMAFLGVDLDDSTSLPQAQQRIDTLRAKAYHWGVWVLMQAGRLMGKDGMRRDIAKREAQQHGWTGIFSNLGTWNVDGAKPWLFCPAISRVYPVGAGCLTMNGRMSLTVQLHAVLCENLATSQALLDAWRLACLPAAAQAQTPATDTAQRELALA
jgi:hypothetical protein